MDDLNHSESLFMACPSDVLYDMVSDVTRMGEWSPICKSCWWDEGESLRVGAWFTGRNETSERTWETRSEVAVAESGREFAFVVGGTWTRWGYTFAPSDGGTVVTESWEFLPGGIAAFEERFGEDAPNQIANRRTTAHVGIAETLAAIKKAAESA